MDPTSDRRNHDALLAGLAAQAGALSSAAAEIVKSVHLNRFARWFVTLVSLIMLVGMTISVWGAIETHKNTSRIISCTEVSGKCYQDNKRSQDSTVSSINDVITATAACTKKPENVTLEQIKACVRKTLAK